MNFTSSFETMGESMIAAAEGNQLISQAIARGLKNAFAKLAMRVRGVQTTAK